MRAGSQLSCRTGPAAGSCSPRSRAHAGTSRPTEPGPANEPESRGGPWVGPPTPGLSGTAADQGGQRRRVGAGSSAPVVLDTGGQWRAGRSRGDLEQARSGQRGPSREVRHLPGGGCPAPPTPQAQQLPAPAAARELEERQGSGRGGPRARAQPRPALRGPARSLGSHWPLPAQATPRSRARQPAERGRRGSGLRDSGSPLAGVGAARTR